MSDCTLGAYFIDDKCIKTLLAKQFPWKVIFMTNSERLMLSRLWLTEIVITASLTCVNNLFNANFKSMIIFFSSMYGFLVI